MNQIIMVLGIGFVTFQFLLVVALMVSAKRTPPRFESGRRPSHEQKIEENLELAVH